MKYNEEDFELAEDLEMPLEAIESPRQQVSITRPSTKVPDMRQQEIEAQSRPVGTRKLSIGEPPIKTQEQFDEDQFAIESEENKQVEANDNGNWWSNLTKYPEGQEQDWSTQAKRYMNNVLGGVLQASPVSYVPNIAKMLAEGASKLVMDEIAEGDPDLALDIATKAANKWTDYIPTQKWLEDVIEKNTGVPLTPKNQLQELMRLGFMAGKFRNGSWIGNTSVGVAAPAISKTLREMEVDPEKADMIGLIGASLPDLAINVTKSLFGNQKAKNLAETLMNKDAPVEPPPPPGGSSPSSYQTAQEARDYLISQNPKPPVEPQPRLTVELPQTRGRGASLQGRARTGGQDVGVRPNIAGTPELRERIGRVFSPQRFRNSSDRGVAAANEIRQQSDLAYTGVNQMYARSRVLNGEIQEMQIPLQTYVQNEIARVGEPVAGSAQAQYLRDLEDLAPLLENPIGNQALIDKIQQWGKKVDFNFEYGDSMNIYRGLMQEAGNAVERAAGMANPEALTAWREARGAYSSWANTFNNKYTRPFRNVRNHDYQKLSKDMLSTDKFNQISHALENSPRGNQILAEGRANIAEKKLDTFAKDPRKMDQRKFDQALGEMEAVAGVTPENINAIRSDFRQARGQRNFRAEYNKPEKPPTATQTKAAKYMRENPHGSDHVPWKPEQVRNMMDDATGIHELRADLVKDEAGVKIYQDMVRHKTRDILLEGNLSKDFTGSNLTKVLENSKNAELLEAMYGREVVEEARQAAKQLGKEHVRKEKMLKLGFSAGAFKFISDLKNVIP